MLFLFRQIILRQVQRGKRIQTEQVYFNADMESVSFTICSKVLSHTWWRQPQAAPLSQYKSGYRQYHAVSISKPDPGNRHFPKHKLGITFVPSHLQMCSQSFDYFIIHACISLAVQTSNLPAWLNIYYQINKRCEIGNDRLDFYHNHETHFVQAWAERFLEDGRSHLPGTICAEFRCAILAVLMIDKDDQGPRRRSNLVVNIVPLGNTKWAMVMIVQILSLLDAVRSLFLPEHNGRVLSSCS